jgi:hypothetical protein
MTIRETAIAKLQQLPEALLQQVSDFIDLLTDKEQHSSAINNPKGELAEVWARWFESVDHLEIIPTKPASDYQQLLLTKYRQQGLEL